MSDKLVPFFQENDKRLSFKTWQVIVTLHHTGKKIAGKTAEPNSFDFQILEDGTLLTNAVKGILATVATGLLGRESFEDGVIVSIIAALKGAPFNWSIPAPKRELIASGLHKLLAGDSKSAVPEANGELAVDITTPFGLFLCAVAWVKSKGVAKLNRIDRDRRLALNIDDGFVIIGGNVNKKGDNRNVQILSFRCDQAFDELDRIYIQQGKTGIDTNKSSPIWTEAVCALLDDVGLDARFADATTSSRTLVGGNVEIGKAHTTQLEHFITTCTDLANKDSALLFNPELKNIPSVYMRAMINHGSASYATADRKIRIGAIDAWLAFHKKTSSQRQPDECKLTTQVFGKSTFQPNQLLELGLIGKWALTLMKIPAAGASVLIHFLGDLLKQIASKSPKTPAEDGTRAVLLGELVLNHLLPVIADILKVALPRWTKEDLSDSSPILPAGVTWEMIRANFESTGVISDRSKIIADLDTKVSNVEMYLTTEEAKLKDLRKETASTTTTLAEITQQLKISEGKMDVLRNVVEDIRTKSLEREAIEGDLAQKAIELQARKKEHESVVKLIAENEQSGKNIVGLTAQKTRMQEEIQQLTSTVASQNTMLESLGEESERVEVAYNEWTRDTIGSQFGRLVQNVNPFLTKEILGQLGIKETGDLVSLRDNLKEGNFITRFIEYLTGIDRLKEINKGNSFWTDFQTLLTFANLITAKIEQLSKREYADISQLLSDATAVLKAFNGQIKNITTILDIDLPFVDDDGQNVLAEARRILQVEENAFLRSTGLNPGDLKKVLSGLAVQKKAIDELKDWMNALATKEVKELNGQHDAIFKMVAGIELAPLVKLANNVQFDVMEVNRVAGCDVHDHSCVADRLAAFVKIFTQVQEATTAKVKQLTDDIEKATKESQALATQKGSIQKEVEKAKTELNAMIANKSSDEAFIVQLDQQLKDLQLKRKYLGEQINGIDVHSAQAIVVEKLIDFRNNHLDKLSAETKALLGKNDLIESLAALKSGSSITTAEAAGFLTLVDAYKSKTAAKKSDMDKMLQTIKELETEAAAFDERKKKAAETKEHVRASMIAASKEEFEAMVAEQRPVHVQQQPQQQIPPWQQPYGFPMPRQSLPFTRNPYEAARLQFAQPQRPQRQPMMPPPQMVPGRRGPLIGSLPPPPPSSLKEYNRLQANYLGFQPRR